MWEAKRLLYFHFFQFNLSIFKLVASREGCNHVIDRMRLCIVCVWSGFYFVRGNPTSLRSIQQSRYDSGIMELVFSASWNSANATEDFDRDAKVKRDGMFRDYCVQSRNFQKCQYVNNEHELINNYNSTFQVVNKAYSFFMMLRKFNDWITLTNVFQTFMLLRG